MACRKGTRGKWDSKPQRGDAIHETSEERSWCRSEIGARWRGTEKLYEKLIKALWNTKLKETVQGEDMSDVTTGQRASLRVYTVVNWCG